MISPVKNSFEASSPHPVAADADGAMFDTASSLMFEHLKRIFLSDREPQATPLQAAATADTQTRG